MCVSSEEPDASAAGAISIDGGGIPQIIVTAPAIDPNLYQNVDWSEVMLSAGLGGLGGIPGGPLLAALDAGSAAVTDYASQLLEADDAVKEELLSMSPELGPYLTPGAPDVYDYR